MLVKGNKLPKAYRLLFIPIMLITCYVNLFVNGIVQHYPLNELEDYGRLLFYLIMSFAESIIYVLLIWFVVSIAKKIYKSGGSHG